MTTRRKMLIALGAGALAEALAALAQQPAKIARIGFLGLSSAAGLASRLDGLRAGLRDLGWVEGKNLAIEFRWAEAKYDRLPALAAELVRLKVDVLVAHGTPGAQAAKQATTTIPIVMVAVSDPVATGLVASLARPGGNITGPSFFTAELNTKRLQLLRDALPRSRRVAVLLNPDNQSMRPILDEMELAAKPLKFELQQFALRAPDEFERAFSEMAARRVEAVIVIDDSMLNVNIQAIAKFAAGRRLPSLGIIELAQAGGLMAYGVNFPELFRRGAYFVDRILKGTQPADLPIERATKYELVVNMKAAKALGITIPQSILVRADRVIE